MTQEFVYGVQPVLQVFSANRRPIKRLWYHRFERSSELQKIFQWAEREGIPCQRVDKGKLSSLVNSEQHQGIVLETETYPYVSFDNFYGSVEKRRPPNLLLILDQIQDPHNLGAILRTAECAGVQGVLLPERGSALVNATVMKISAGAAEHLKIVLAKNLARALDELKKIPFWIYGSEEGEHPAYFEQDYRGNTAFVMGNEGSGLRRLVREKCDFLISIPLIGKISSLNVSVATGVLLFEALRQRKKG